jgi:hypothetical protein
MNILMSIQTQEQIHQLMRPYALAVKLVGPKPFNILNPKAEAFKYWHCSFKSRDSGLYLYINKI